MDALGESIAHMTVLRRKENGLFAFEFCGSAVAAIFCHDFTGETITTFDKTEAEIEWAERLRPVLKDGECHLQKGATGSEHTSPIDYLALDLPLKTPGNNGIDIIVSCTAPVI